jgi:endonuclease-3
MTGDEISREIRYIKKRVEELANQDKKIKCTFFETATVMAFHHFARRRVDFAVVEVGMGGRLDSTNVLDPEVAVITNVSREHMKHLGKSIGKIAGEKAGIVKKGVPTVWGSDNRAAAKVIRERCDELGSELLSARELVRMEVHRQDIYGCSFSIKTQTHEVPDVQTRLAGEHQLSNIATAVLSVGALKSGIKISNKEIRTGIERTQWPARLQVIRTGPYVVLDTTHNPGGAITLARYIEQQFAKKRPVGVFGVLEDKDVKGIVKELEGCFSEIVITAPSFNRRMPAEELGSLFPSNVTVMKDVGKAVGKAIEIAGKRPVMISGSIFTASDAAAHLELLRIKEIMKRLGDEYLIGAYPGRDPGGKRPPDEEARDPFRVLISTILSQRTRDENTHVASTKLFAKYRSAEELSRAKPKDIELLIKPVGFPQQKAKNIIETAGIVVDRYRSKVPDDLDELIKLPGVGRKTANCVLAYGFRKPAIAVDTHVHRITNLIGLVNTGTPDHTEYALKVLIPKKYWLEVNRLFVRHGQQICKPIRPQCENCPLAHLCDTGIYKLRI